MNIVFLHTSTETIILAIKRRLPMVKGLLLIILILGMFSTGLMSFLGAILMATALNHIYKEEK